MLHELSHNVHGPHDEKFNALWDQLRKEHEALVAKGYTGEGFLSKGKKLGGRRIPIDEARRIARTAAEKRRNLTAGSGQRLGGAPVRAGTDIRKVILDAIERRSTVMNGCGQNNNNDKEIKELADQATQNGFKTQADEDEANARAIEQALWELIQEDEKREYGDSYVPSTPTNPTGNGGGATSPRKENRPGPSKSHPPSCVNSNPPNRPLSRLITEQPPTKKSKPIPKLAEDIIPRKASTPDVTDKPNPGPIRWTCPICTLHNPINYLCCDACTTERPEAITKRLADESAKAIITARKSTPRDQTWQCQRCDNIMGDEWWTCSICGKMKESSKGDQKTVIL